jgi:hypothetical protein
VRKAIKITCAQYVKTDLQGDPTDDSVDYAFNKIQGICRVNDSGGFEQLSQLYYIRGILRNRIYCDDQLSMSLMKDAISRNASIESLTKIAKECKNWTEWKDVVSSFILENEVISGDNIAKQNN